MRRRVLGVAMAAVLLAVTLFGVPLAIAVDRLIYADEATELERFALLGAVSVSPDFAATRDPIELRPLPSSDVEIQVGVYDRTGRRVAGRGPVTADSPVRAALGGSVSTGSAAGDPASAELVVAVPVFSAEQVVAVSRAASPRAEVQAEIWRTWAAMLGVALVAAACALLLAAIQARRLAVPLERLESVAEELGEGNFATRAPTTGIGEIDRAGQALNQTAQRLGDLVARERAFSATASHQLRTPVTGLRLGLEAALATPGADIRAAAGEAVELTDQLSRTIDDVLQLAREPLTRGGRIAVPVLLDDLERRWHGPLAATGRPLRVRQDSPPDGLGSLPAVRQILDVLVDNALRHGAGVVCVVARRSSDALALDVVDEGRATRALLPLRAGASSARLGPGRIGLSLAVSLAEAQGGRLVHAHGEGSTRLTLLLPACPLGDRASVRGDPPPGTS